MLDIGAGSGRDCACLLANGFDHAIPFLLWGNNDLWNLMQAHTKVNALKSDKLPSAQLVVARKHAILEDWAVLREAMPDVFDRQASHLLG